MPIREFACLACGETFEELVLRRADEDEVRCRRCGSQKLERQLSRTAATTGGRGGGGPGPGCGPVG